MPRGEITVTIYKDTWVEIEKIVLTSKERANNIPMDTKSTDLKMLCKGFLLQDSLLGEEAEIITLTGRIVKGMICKVNPSYDHGFGDFIPEIMYIGIQARSLLEN